MRYPSAGLLLLLITSLSGCDKYLFTFNEQAIYSPAPLFSSYQINDQALRECVAQTITDGQISEAKHLLGLHCTAAGINDLNGLSVFASLETLILANNNITSIEPLLSMPSLISVNLVNNSALNCRAIKRLEAQGTKVLKPAHCQDE